MFQFNDHDPIFRVFKRLFFLLLLHCLQSLAELIFVKSNDSRLCIRLHTILTVYYLLNNLLFFLCLYSYIHKEQLTKKKSFPLCSKDEIFNYFSIIKQKK